jgi:hypothetical protein
MRVATVKRVLLLLLVFAFLLPPNAAQAGGHHVRFVRQFGTQLYDWVADVVVTERGMFVVGSTAGAFRGFEAPTAFGGVSTAAFVRGYRNGNLRWTHQFSPSDSDWATGVAADPTGVYVAGGTWGALDDKRDKGRNDAWVRKYSFAGEALWTRQYGSNQDDLPGELAVHDGRLYVVGATHGRLPGQTHFSGDYDAFVKAFTTDGHRLWTDEFGTDTSESASEVGVDASGVYVAGYTYGTLPGEHQRGEDDGFVRKYDLDGHELWTQQFGSREVDYPTGLAVGTNRVYVAGNTYGTLKGETAAGELDVFVSAFARGGSSVWIEQFGTPRVDEIGGIDLEGRRLYVAGDLQLDGGSGRRSNSEAFVRAFGLSGVGRWTQDFGTDAHDSALAIDVFPGDRPRLTARAYVAGQTTGAFEGQTRNGKSDVFVVGVSV